MKKILILLVILGMVGAAYCFTSSSSDKKQIAIIVPMEHEALDKIVQGFKDEFAKTGFDVGRIKVMNGQGDMNIQRAIIQQLSLEKCDVLVPIGTACSQMTLNLAPDLQIVCLAANPDLLSKNTTRHATLLDDQVSVGSVLTFMHDLFPKIQKITLIYSGSEKVAAEIPQVAEEATRLGIRVQKLMVQNHSELYTAGEAIDKDSGAIFVLKDHLIVSGIQTLVRQGEKRHIPVITSDEGSVINGGAFALGVREAAIGEQGANIVNLILGGKSPEFISPQTLKGPYPLFVNKDACERQGIQVDLIVKCAEEREIPVEFVNQKRI